MQRRLRGGPRFEHFRRRACFGQARACPVDERRQRTDRTGGEWRRRRLCESEGDGHGEGSRDRGPSASVTTDCSGLGAEAQEDSVWHRLRNDGATRLNRRSRRCASRQTVHRRGSGPGTVSAAFRAGPRNPRGFHLPNRWDPAKSMYFSWLARWVPLSPGSHLISQHADRKSMIPVRLYGYSFSHAHISDQVEMAPSGTQPDNDAERNGLFWVPPRSERWDPGGTHGQPVAARKKRAPKWRP